jgi:endogenous inhibitor of DNA gyrase (YacG/DUF329 family)
MTFRCPICRKQVPGDAPTRPFCSNRCKLLDLGNWAAERYVISTPIRDAEDFADNRNPGECKDQRDE